MFHFGHVVTENRPPPNNISKYRRQIGSWILEFGGKLLPINLNLRVGRIETVFKAVKMGGIT